LNSELQNSSIRHPKIRGMVLRNNKEEKWVYC
jgi:hypothetical protein